MGYTMACQPTQWDSWDNKGTSLEVALGTDSGNYKDRTCLGETHSFLHISLAADFFFF